MLHCLCAGVYNADLRQAYSLKDDAWKYDIMPEILDGHNVLDFVDADIDARLAELEREEEELEVGDCTCAGVSRRYVWGVFGRDFGGMTLGCRCVAGGVGEFGGGACGGRLCVSRGSIGYMGSVGTGRAWQADRVKEGW